MNNSINNRSSRSMLCGTVTKREGKKKIDGRLANCVFQLFLPFLFSCLYSCIFLSSFPLLLLFFLLLLLLFASMPNALLPARLEDKRLKLSSTKHTSYRRYKYTYKIDNDNIESFN